MQKAPPEEIQIPAKAEENVVLAKDYFSFLSDHFVGIRLTKFLIQFDWLFNPDRIKIRFLHDPITYVLVGTEEEIQELYNMYESRLQEIEFVSLSDVEKRARKHRKEFRERRGIPS